MREHLPAFKAWENLHNRAYSSQLDSEGIYELVLQATGDERLADELASFRGMARLRRGLPA